MLAALCCAVFCSKDFGPDVTHITANNFGKEIEKRSNTTVYFVMFHGEHCPACQMAYPEFSEAAKESSGMIKFGHIDTSREYGLASKFNIRGIPTFIIFHPKGQQTYMRERSARAFLNTASKFIPQLAKSVDDSWKASEKSVILFSDKPSSPPIWSAISCEFHESDVSVGFSNNQTLAKEFGVTAFPTILMIEGEKKMVYSGKVKFGLIKTAIKNFFSGTLTPAPTPQPTAAPQLIHDFVDIGDIDKYCKGKGVFCVLKGAGISDEKFEAAARKYRHDRFRFYTCGEQSPLTYPKKGLWILHHRRDAAIKVTDEKLINANLDRVIDGGARFEPLEDLIGGEL